MLLLQLSTLTSIIEVVVFKKSVEGLMFALQLKVQFSPCCVTLLSIVDNNTSWLEV